MSRTETIQVRVTPKLLSDVEKHASNEHLTVSTFGEVALEEAVAKRVKRRRVRR